ncbi:MAG: hypothetical protein J4G15_16515 [Alphaproteobacteria bacterium]|nr:hypothetical protein [Alphaproteobacteria bacterium]
MPQTDQSPRTSLRPRSPLNSRRGASCGSLNLNPDDAAGRALQDEADLDPVLGRGSG